MRIMHKFALPTDLSHDSAEWTACLKVGFEGTQGIKTPGEVDYTQNIELSFYKEDGEPWVWSHPMILDGMKTQPNRYEILYRALMLRAKGIYADKGLAQYQDKYEPEHEAILGKPTHAVISVDRIFP